MAKEKLNDFGGKIGFARKDLAGGLTSEIISSMTDEERKKYVTKNTLWPLENARSMCAEGMDAFVLYWRREMRKLVKNAPTLYLSDDSKEILRKCEEYRTSLEDYRLEIEKVTTEDEINAFYQHTIFSSLYADRFSVLVSLNNLRYSYIGLSHMRRKCKESGFPSSSSERKVKQRKRKFIPDTITNIEETNWIGSHDITPEWFLKTFDPYGVEFGNWTNDDSRKLELQHLANALVDLAKVLGICLNDTAFHTFSELENTRLFVPKGTECYPYTGRLKLSFAYGSRGKSSALAHYEPVLHVINLTKMKGAGCLAHEWFHSLDRMLAIACGIPDQMLASESRFSNKIPAPVRSLFRALLYEDDGRTRTAYYRNSHKADMWYTKESNGYWSSTCEMGARAFACYVSDRLEMRSDFLVGLSQSYQMEDGNGNGLTVVPQGKDRERLNQKFDEMFAFLRESGFFTACEHPENTLEFPKTGFAWFKSTLSDLKASSDISDEKKDEELDSYTNFFTVGKGGQLTFL